MSINLSSLKISTEPGTIFGIEFWNSTVDKLQNLINGNAPLVYTALVTQSGTNAPSFIVLQNTIGDIEWSYLGVGSYRGTLSNAFPLGKSGMINGFGGDEAKGFLNYYFNDENTIDLVTSNPGQDLANNILNNSTLIKIEVYP